MAWLLLALPIILLALLVVPFRVYLLLGAGLEWQVTLKVKWAFWTLKRRERSRGQGKNKQAKASRARRSLGLTPLQLVRLGNRYVRRFWRALHLRCGYLDIDLLLADPAMLGYICAFCGMNDWPREPVSLSVGMADEFAFDLEVSVQARLYPIEWLFLLLRLAFEPPIRRLWWRKRKGEVKHAGPEDTGRTTGKPHLKQNSDRRPNISG